MSRVYLTRIWYLLRSIDHHCQYQVKCDEFEPKPIQNGLYGLSLSIRTPIHSSKTLVYIRTLAHPNRYYFIASELWHSYFKLNEITAWCVVPRYSAWVIQVFQSLQNRCIMHCMPFAIAQTRHTEHWYWMQWLIGCMFHRSLHLTYMLLHYEQIIQWK